MKMPNEEPKLKYSIYKLSDVVRCKQALTNRGYSPLPLKTDYNGWELYLSRPSHKPPKWIPVLSDIVLAYEVLRGISNTTNSFVLIIASGSDFFAVCGGFGASAIQKFIIEDFGLDIVSRVVEPNKIKYRRAKNFSGDTLQEESLYKDYYNYEFDTSNWVKLTKEILGEIKRNDLTEFFGLTPSSKHKIRLDGKNSIAINRSISIEDLKILIEKISQIQNLQPKFTILKGFKEIVSKVKRTQLDDALINILTQEFSDFCEDEESFEETTIGLSYSDIREFIFCDSFEIKLGSYSKFLDEDLNLKEIFKALRENNVNEFHPSYIYKMTITGRSEDEFPRIDTELRSFLYAEITYEGELYFLIDSKWFLVTREFSQEANNRFNAIISSSAVNPYSLPTWDLVGSRVETEDSYIDRVCRQSGLNKLHRKHIIINGSDKCEICDIVDLRTNDTMFVHVKKGLGSQLKELASQCRPSAELYIKDATFRNKSISKINTVTPSPALSYDPKDITWVLAFTDHKLNRSHQSLSTRLGTIVKMDIIHTFEFLTRDLGVKAHLYEIPHSA